MDTSAKADEKTSMEKESQIADEKPENVEIISEQLSSKASLHDSEYESVDSGDNYSDNEESRQRHSGDSGHSGSESGSVILERQEGDGQEHDQENAPQKKVDDDQDKKNPQYIPKRGTFYEHDDRTADDVENTEVADAEKADKDGKKKVWQDKKERWSHDKFNDNEQMPKSKAELIATYGYDIRNEDGPPRARRRRRYGRGPNKYTRNWEDEDAYNKPPPSTKKRSPRKPKPRRSNDGEYDNQSPREDSQHEDSAVSSSNNTKPQQTRVEIPEQNYSPPSKQENHYQEQRVSRNQEPHIDKQNSKNQGRVGTGRVMKPFRPPAKDYQESDYRGFTKPRHFRSSNVRNNEKRHEGHDDFIQSQNYSNKNLQQNVQDIEKDMNRMTVSDSGPNYSKNKHSNGNNQNRQNSVPPRLQAEQKGSKRYSSIRQRSLPETANPPLSMPHPNYYTNDFPQQNQQTQQQILQHHGPAQMPQIPPPPLPTIPQVPVTSTPILQAPPQFGNPFPQPAPFLQPAVPAPPFLPQQTPQLINYVQSQPQFPQPAFQEFPQQFNPVTQPAELFTPSPGITYYNPQQQASQRPVPQKRPKAAIPIVAPPPLEPRGRGRAQQELADAGPSELAERLPTPHEEPGSFEDATVTAQQ